MKTALELYNTDTGGVTKELLRELKSWLDWLPDSPEREDGLWSCHAVARAVKFKWSVTFRDWVVVDGHFRTSQHCWLAYKVVILDMYPVASLGGPVLLDGSFWGQVFRPEKNFYNEKELDEFDRQADLLLTCAQRKFDAEFRIYPVA